jgi:hypothetical protein
LPKKRTKKTRLPERKPEQALQSIVSETQLRIAWMSHRARPNEGLVKPRQILRHLDHLRNGFLLELDKSAVSLTVFGRKLEKERSKAFALALIIAGKSRLQKLEVGQKSTP